jgi:hypothetical protein
MMTCNEPGYRPGGNAMFSDMDFCTHYLATCTGGMMSACTAYNSLSMTLKHCRSEHLCNAVLTPAQVSTHCGHAAGMMLCN